MALTALYDLPAPAKINLFLHVVGRRADGYHLLQSAFVLIDWMDSLHLELRRDGGIGRVDLGAALPEDDLCLRAARALQQASGCHSGVQITLDKRVPWGAGLGGGSSDAATVLLGLNRLWGLHWPRQRLLEIGLTLGADVPFFIGGRNAWVEGIGEQLTPVPIEPRRYLLVKPPVAIPTQAIFSSPLLRRDTAPTTMAVFLADQDHFGVNNLQAAAAAFSAQVDEAIELLERHVGPARMTGSGSAVFACAGGNPGADDGSSDPGQVLATLPQGWIGRMCRSLEVHPLHGWAKD
ncbi:MAG: 4-(cytidine 5'-diphospho)-2-C-methyl-D-erythritol kinase [Burkholderiaceae bacterium]|nr:4-(cytidine 5'-diphospho)-2-C-methyl-D-erythritol kinase [Burkholderiaceae bacterium]